MKAFVRNTAIALSLFGIFVACGKKSSSDKSKEENQVNTPAETAAPAPALKPQETATPALLDGTWKLTDVYCMDTSFIVTNDLRYYFQSLKIEGTTVLGSGEFNNSNGFSPSRCEYEFSLVASTPDSKIVVGSETGRLAPVSAGGSCPSDKVVERQSFSINSLAPKTLALRLTTKEQFFQAENDEVTNSRKCDYLTYRYVR
jgi:hypothetical protein